MRKIVKIIICSLLVSACIDKPMQEFDEQQVFSPDFDFETTKKVTIDIQLADVQSEPLSGILVRLYNTENSEKKQLLFKAFTDANGEIKLNYTMASDIDQLIVETNYIGVPNDVLVPVNGGNVEFKYEKGEIQSAIIVNQSRVNKQIYTGRSSSNDGSLTFNYIGSYNYNGVPDYLEPDNDVISAALLSYINTSLPEKLSVPDYHPTYLANGRKTTLDIVETCDVWVTFVHEGAGFRNAIGFYTYQTNSPPQSINDLTTINVIFPNLSYAGSGGGLISGNKVNIGQYEAGTSIGLVLMANGWNGSNSEDYYHLVYADKNLNPESDDDLKQHNVLLWDEDNELFLLGFEDILRDHRPFRCDNDFNDAILFVTSNPVEGISTIGVSPIDEPGTTDSDGDGINDILDEYPDDPNKAYDSYYPSETNYGTFAFEDNWPDYGDYDFNDLVIDYRFRHTLNASNGIVAMEPSFIIRAAGAGYRNGFGFSTNLSPSDVSSSTGASLNTGYVTNNANGTEAGQTNAVFIVAENVHDLFSTTGFVNTETESPYLDPQEIKLDIIFNTSKSYEEIGSVPYNPFLIVSGNRQREIHLMGYPPTDLVDQTLFGTLDDDTNVDLGVYYKSKTDLPWAINLPESFAYPKEKVDIRQGHLRFTEWSLSSGYSYMDWYKNRQGYRSNTHLYSND